MSLVIAAASRGFVLIKSDGRVTNDNGAVTHDKTVNNTIFTAVVRLDRQ